MIDIYRPEYHFTPPTNWMNDPNGMVFFDGEYHLFYQYHPHSTVWGPMHWGHAVSTDLIHWQHLPIALYPDEIGMIFSGSAVVDVNNTAGFGKNALVAIFTYNKDYKESQNLAYSTDRGRTWTKYPHNPVVPAPEPLSDCRDPKVFWHEDHWVMLLAAKDRVLFLTSTDLKNWQQSGSFGGGFGSTIGVWETPDLFQLPLRTDGETRWVLTVGVGDGGPSGGSGTQYFIGYFDGITFISENQRDTILWADYGADYYAPQSWNNEPHGRRIMFGWMSNWQYARSVPSDGWRGMFSLPREMALTSTMEGVRLVQSPIHELESLRVEGLHWKNQILQPGQNLLNDLIGDAFEIVAEFQVQALTNSFGFHIRQGSGERTTVGYNSRSQKVFIDRTISGQSAFHTGFAAVHSAHLEPQNEVVCLHIFVDRCSVEVFANNGIAAISDLIYPSPQSLGLELFTEGSEIFIKSLDVYPLSSSTPTHIIQEGNL
ncbi:MAG: glycoside hydrolase family 32 protein [Anaerolineales bacterium]